MGAGRLIANLPSVGPTIIIPVREHDWGDAFPINKFGRNPDIDSGTVEDVWSQGGTKQYQSAGVSLFASSSNAGDTVDIEMQGLDADGLRQTQVFTLTGQTKLAIPGTTWLREFVGFNVSSTNLLGDVYIYEDDTLTGGVPNTAANIRIKIDQAKQRTHMAIYTIPATYTGYMLHWYSSLLRNNTAGAANVEIFARNNGQVFTSQNIRGEMAGGKSDIDHPYPVALPFDPLTDLRMVADVTGNANDITGGFALICIKNKD